MYKKLFLILIVILPLLGSCQKNKGQIDPKKIELPTNGYRVVEANNTFGIDIFSKINTISPNQNLMFSPLSLHIAMSMAYNGTCKQTSVEIQNALKLNDISLEDINKCYKTIIKELVRVDKKVTFSVANSFWFDKNFSVQNEYKENLEENYYAEVQNIDFSSPSTVNTINNWCSEQTKGKIDKIIDKLSNNEVAALLNALYFNGKWYNKFDKNNTQNLDFNLSDKSKIKVPTMQQQNDFKAQVYETFTAVELPYGQGNFVIDLFLPAENKTIADVLDSLANFKNIFNSFVTCNVNIFLPKFEYKSDFDLISILKTLGINEAFGDNADFCKISNSQQIKISKVKQKTYIKLDEEGTEAAAVTHVGFELTAVQPNQYLEVHFDRPFLYLIREVTTNTILFIGTVANPQ